MLTRLAAPLLLSAPFLLAAPPPAEGPPPWFEEHASFMARDGGYFVGDNSDYRSAGEPFDAYGMEWSHGLGQHGLKGRLFGLAGGEERGTFWEFRVFYDPASKRVRMLQFGADGTLGEGWLEPAPERPGTLVSEQVLTGLDGSRREVRHETRDAGGTHTATSFRRAAEAPGSTGAWVQERAYDFVRQARGD